MDHSGSEVLASQGLKTTHNSSAVRGGEKMKDVLTQQAKKRSKQRKRREAREEKLWASKSGPVRVYYEKR